MANHPERLYPALVRSGPLDRYIALRLPNRSALARFPREHLGEHSLPGVALAAVGMAGADRERLLRGYGGVSDRQSDRWWCST